MDRPPDYAVDVGRLMGEGLVGAASLDAKAHRGPEVGAPGEGQRFCLDGVDIGSDARDRAE